MQLLQQVEYITVTSFTCFLSIPLIPEFTEKIWFGILYTSSQFTFVTHISRLRMRHNTFQLKSLIILEFIFLKPVNFLN